MEENWYNKGLIEKLKPYIFCLFVAFCQGGANVISKICLNNGMNLYVLVVYGGVFGTLTTAVLALIFERTNKSKLCFQVCLNLLLLGLLGFFSRILFFNGMDYTSAAFATAMNNLTPSLTLLLAILCRMEKLGINKISGQAKIGGTIIALGGATLMTLYKGIPVLQLHNSHINHQISSKTHIEKSLKKGSFFILLQTLITSICYILQTTIVKKYPAPFTISALSNLAGTIFSTIIAVIIDHKASSWKLSWNINLVAPLYGGVVMSGVAGYIQTLVIQKKGPVFATAFRPFSTVIVALMGLTILAETLFLGRVLGAILIIIGLYATLWGKEDERRKSQIGTETSEDQVLDIRTEM